MTDAGDLERGGLSREAAGLHDRLLREGRGYVGKDADEIPLDDPAVAELIERRAARLALVPAAGGLPPAARLEILRLLALGKTDAAIAAERGQSVRTVRRHIGEMMADLDAKSRFAAGVAAVRRGWL